MDYKIKPWAHQIKAIEAAKDRHSFALFFEVGTGKSLTSINIARYKYLKHGGIIPTLILCPLIVMENWKRELLANTDVLPLQISIPSGSGVRRAQMIKDMRNKQPNSILILNYDSLIIEPVFTELLAWNPQMIIYDEVHKCKNPTSKRTKRATALADRATYRFILSGTPVLNSPMDLFAQFRIMDRGKSFGLNFMAFKHHYFWDKNAAMPKGKYFPDWRIKPGAMEAFNEIISKTGMTAKKSECLDLPPLIKKPIYVELSPEQRRIYTELKKDLITFLNDKACTAPIALTKSLRLQQISSGYFVGEGLDGHKEEITLKNNPRALALEELLEEHAPNHKIIIWAVFKNNYQTIREICDKLKLPMVEVHGEIETRDKFANVDRFNNDDSCRILLGHPGSGGEGINLTASSMTIFYSRSFSLGHYLQAEARNYRGGSEIHEAVFCYDIVARDTIDEVVQKALANKQEISDKLLRECQGAL